MNRATLRAKNRIDHSLACVLLALLLLFAAILLPRMAIASTDVLLSGVKPAAIIDESHYGVDGASVASISDPMEVLDCHEMYDAQGNLVRYSVAYNGASTSVVVPEALDGIPVGYLRSLVGNTQVEEVYLPDSMQNVPADAFCHCTSLRKVNLGGLVDTLPAGRLTGLLWGCTSLERLTMSDSANFEIRHNGSYGKDLNIMDADTVDSLKYIYLGSGMSDVGLGLFYGDSLEWVDVGEENPLYSSHDGVVYSSDGTRLLVMGSSYTGDYTIPGTCTSIDEVGFEKCTKAGRIYVPASVTSIGSPGVFSRCTATFVTPKGSYADLYIKKNSIDVNVEYDGKVDGYREDISLAEVAVDDKTYTGLPLEPNPKVVFDNETLVSGVDYDVAYANSTNTGTATVTITGIGNYTGTKSVAFTILPADVSGANVSAIADQTYTGKAIKPAPAVKFGSTTLKSGTDYTVAYKSNTNAGTATVTIAGKGNFAGTKSVTFKITPAAISKATVDAVADQAYTGKAIKPTPAVKVGSATLKSGTDYTLSYKNNTNAGTATVIIAGKGNYTGTKSVTFKIVKKVEPVATQEMYRLYNPNSGEHFYTAKAAERDALVKVGWVYEGVGWTAPVKSKTPVYRLYNRVAGDHHYTMKAAERDALLKIKGWVDEGVGWYSDDAQGTPLYRQYNPNAVTGSHNYTTNKKENDALVKMGWIAEGIGWYGVK